MYFGYSRFQMSQHILAIGFSEEEFPPAANRAGPN
jgi:hypothetical protein